jgi:2-keto-4-pentenoate hydratase/2-oxohepta-3-ene-1,7-dioic acid hydratase in catechol pathway
MAFDPAALVAFHSNVFPLQPGDIISTGTPGAVVVNDGDVVECRIEGVGSLTNPVRRL